ncbi:hypothetical protein MMC13_006702 [Lambiella insularis]|nr:hypothetical protein [Lambiella insularis]
MRASTQLRLFRPSSVLPFSRPTNKSLLTVVGSSQPLQPRRHTRFFVTNPLNAPQTLHATRTLPYPASALYALIADIASYPSFLPYCTSSTITSWSAPHPSTSTRYPRSATLTAGFQAYTESFHSHVFCAPDTAVEAVCGDARTTLQEAELVHYKDSAASRPATADAASSKEQNPIFTSLLTRWSLREYPYKPPPQSGKPQQDSAPTESKPRTEVKLFIEVQFASAMYAALSQAAAGKVAGMMVEAFEKRARDVLGEGDVGGRMGTVEDGNRVGEEREGTSSGRDVGSTGLEGVISRKESP